MDGGGNRRAKAIKLTNKKQKQKKTKKNNNNKKKIMAKPRKQIRNASGLFYKIFQPTRGYYCPSSSHFRWRGRSHDFIRRIDW